MIRIGKIVATHGLQGSLVMTHIVGHSRWLKNGEALFIEMGKESYIPYFVVQSKSAKTDEYVINVEDVNTVESARRLVGKHVYASETILEAHAKDSPLLWMGFMVTDETSGELGPIDDMMFAGTQWLARVIYQGAEVLIPLVPQMVKKVDLKKKTIQVDLPEGLLEVYLKK